MSWLIQSVLRWSLSALQRHIPLRVGFEHSSPPRDALSLISAPWVSVHPRLLHLVPSPDMWGSLSADFSDSEVSELDFCLSGGITGLGEQACALVSPFPSIGTFPWEQWCPWDPLCWAVIIRAPVILQICDASWNIIIFSIKDLFRFVNSLFSSAHLRRTSCFSSLGRVTWSCPRWIRCTFHECFWESPSLSLASLSLERGCCLKSEPPVEAPAFLR